MLTFISTRKKISIILFTLFFFILLSVIGISFTYKKYYNEVDRAIYSFINVLVWNFNINETVADAISVRHLQYNASPAEMKLSVPPALQCDEKYKLYGINMYSENDSHDFSGTLQSERVIHGNDFQLIKSINDVLSRYEYKDNFFQRKHYFISYNEDYIYFTDFTPLKTYHFNQKRVKSFNIFRVHPDYITRKFRKDPITKGTTSIDIDIDPITHRHAYSVVSYVYDLSDNSSKRISGAMMFDYTDRDLREIMQSLSANIDDRIVSAKIFSRDSGKSIYFVGNTDQNDSKSMKISTRYSIEFSLSPLYFALYHPYALWSYVIALLCSLIEAVALIYYMRQHGKENMTDFLTGVYNRKALSSIQFNNPAVVSTLVVIDCNKFKVINDTWGHEMGDKALVHIADVFKRSTRHHGDAIIRLGGDEFCLILSDTNTPKADEILTRINQQLASFSGLFRLSITWGAVEIDQNESVEEAIIRADALLYARKSGSAHQQRGISPTHPLTEMS